jgi:hypothetical protein
MDAPHPILIHHFTKSFKNSAIPNDSDDYLGLISWDDTVSPVRLDPSNLFKLAGDGTMDANGVTRNSFSVVDKNYLMQASNTIRFEEAQVINQGHRIFLRRCIPVPPFVAMTIINSGPLDAHDMGTVIATLFRSIEQDAHHILYGVVTSDPGRKAAREILSWLFMAKLHQDMRMSCSTVFPGSKLDMLAKSIQLSSIQDSQPQNRTGEGEILRDIFERNTAAIQELAENRKVEAERTALSNEKGFHKLPQDMQDFLLAVGSQDLENPVDVIGQSGLDLLKMTQKNAIASLSKLLKKERKQVANLSMAQLTEITSIQWFSSSNPFIGLSLCRIPPLSRSVVACPFDKAQKLELLQKLELEKEEVFNTLTDRTLFQPTTVDDLLRNVDIIQGILEIYVGPESAIVQKIADFHHEICSSRMQLELRITGSDPLLTKIQFAFDSRLNHWLECMYENASNILEVNHGLVEFSSIIQNIVYGSFFIELPPSLLPAPNNKKRPAPIEEDNEGDGQSNQNTRQKKGTANPNVNPNWKLKENENWSMFTKDPNRLRPSSVCMMYHILGHCPQGRNCRRARSHGALNDSQKQQTNAFIEDRRRAQNP